MSMPSETSRLTAAACGFCARFPLALPGRRAAAGNSESRKGATAVTADLLIRRQDGISEVSPVWQDKAVIVIATGASLTAGQCAVARRLRESDVARVIAVSDALYMAPFADVLYFADERWWG